VYHIYFKQNCQALFKAKYCHRVTNCLIVHYRNKKTIKTVQARAIAPLGLLTVFNGPTSGCKSLSSDDSWRDVWICRSYCEFRPIWLG